MHEFHESPKIGEFRRHPWKPLRNDLTHWTAHSHVQLDKWHLHRDPKAYLEMQFRDHFYERGHVDDHIHHLHLNRDGGGRDAGRSSGNVHALGLRASAHSICASEQKNHPLQKTAAELWESIAGS